MSRNEVTFEQLEAARKRMGLAWEAYWKARQEFEKLERMDVMSFLNRAQETIDRSGLDTKGLSHDQQLPVRDGIDGSDNDQLDDRAEADRGLQVAPDGA